MPESRLGQARLLGLRTYVEAKCHLDKRCDRLSQRVEVFPKGPDDTSLTMCAILAVRAGSCWPMRAIFPGRVVTQRGQQERSAAMEDLGSPILTITFATGSFA